MFKRTAKLIGHSVKSTYNVFAWIGAKPLKDSTSSIAKMSKPIFSKKEKYDHKGESFAEATERFNLSEADLIAKDHALTQQVRLYVGLLGVLALYLCFLLIRLDLLLAFILLGVMGLVVCKFYQAHYRRYCIRTKSLNNSFSQWRRDFFGSKGK